jgi:hypothetical protein
MEYNLLEYPECEKLVKQFYPDPNNILLKKYVDDPFFLGENMKKIYDWYLSKNPEFKIMSTIVVEMPEYNILIAGIIKDLYINSKNTQNLKNYSDILQKIEIMINSKYLYSLIIDIIYDYLLFFQKKVINNNNEYKNYKIDKCSKLLKYYKSQYIIFPSFKQIDLYKVILNMKAPVLNFLVTNRKHITHNETSNICTELWHDIDIHYDKMMISFFRNIMIARDIKYSNFSDVVNFIDKNKCLFSTYFIFMNKFISELESNFIYSIVRRKNTTFENLKKDSNFKEYMNCVVLFYLFHEVDFFDKCISKIKNISLVKKNTSAPSLKLLELEVTNERMIPVIPSSTLSLIKINDSETIIKYIMENYFLKISSELLRKTKYNNRYCINMLQIDFVELMKDTLFINTKLLSENIIQKYSCEIIQLYGTSTIFIYEEMKKIFGFI